MIKWAIAFIAVALGLGFLVQAGATQGYDRALLSAVALEAGQGADGLFALAQFLTWVGDAGRRLVIVAGLALWLLWRRRWAAAAIMLVVPQLTSLASSLMKDGFARPRPDLVPHLDHVANLSYPSGHAANAMALFVLSAMILAPAAKRRAWMLAAMLGAALVGVSRMLLGVHWPTDVIGGWMLGLGFAALGWMLLARFQGRQARA